MKPWALAAIVVSAAAAGAAFYLYRQRAEQVELPPAPLVPAATLVETLPHFQLADRDGQLRSLADWPGNSLVVNFWATWCAPCRREIPLLLQLQRDHAAEGLQVVGIAVDFREKVLAYADETITDRSARLRSRSFPCRESAIRGTSAPPLFFPLAAGVERASNGGGNAFGKPHLYVFN